MTQFATVNAPRSSLLRADIAVIIVAVIMGLGFSKFLGTANAPFIAQVDINPSLTALPGYALLSLVRSMLALALSYIFAIIYGSLAANNKTLEKILIPLLDVLQSLPVVAFLPGFVLALISIFHSSRWGLELACILSVFIGQVWNLAFAYYESQRTLQPEFVEVAKIYRLSSVRKFFSVDLPNGYRPLIYNGMMSMAGGWFFLTTCEDFPLGNQNFRLPGLGSYLAETFASGAYTNFVIGLLVLLFIIIGTDVLLWKPLIAWVTRFRDGDDGQKVVEESWFLSIIRNTNIPTYITIYFKKLILILFPKSHMEDEGATRRYLIDNIDKWITVFNTNKFLSNEKIKKVKQSSVITFIVTFAIGGAVFSLLPKLPSLGQSMAVLTNNDWFELIHAVFLTGIKVFLVIIFSTLWTVPVGLYLGLNPRLERLCQPVIQNLAAFPAPVLFPLIAMVLAKTFFPAFFDTTLLMCVGSQWYILFNVIGGASRIPAELKLVARIYKFTLLQRFTRLYFPAILPSLATGWITAAGGAWNASMVAEIVLYPGGILKSNGIGAELTNASASGNYIRLIAAIICIVVALVILNRTVWRTLHIYSEQVKD